MITPPEPATGARPIGATDEQSAAKQVQRMFDSIAPTYDRLNHILSVGLDRTWWRRAAKAVLPRLQDPDTQILDLCCGTGDMTSALLAHRPPNAAPITGLDFSPQMLDLARTKHAHSNAIFVEGDAMHLPYPDNTFDLVTSAFGFRNLANYAEGLAEIHRVLRPTGQIAILECNQPSGLFGATYSIYFKHILPRVVTLLSGDPTAYAYLPASVERFPRPPPLRHLHPEAHNTNPTWTSYTLGVAGLYRATKP
jgi:demethylmenaquinone methyltransferase/2-methoxy-6-polyprenyl-1,4-benzoquinol methylase